MRRNQGLDGLRGIAVILVTLDHSNVPIFRFGGTVGVTLFFVLSGYLITTLLLKEARQNGRVSLPNFYMRRVLRLLPALFVALLGGAVIFKATGAGRLGKCH